MIKNSPIFTTLLVFFVVTSFSELFSQGTYTSTGVTNNWNATTTWTGSGDVPNDGIPDANDNVIIATGHGVNVNVTSACGALTINGTGILNFPTNPITLTVNGLMTMNGTSQVTGNNNNRILSLLGDFTVPSGAIASIGGIRVSQAITASLNLYGTLFPTDNTGTKTFGNANFYNGSAIDATVTETITVAGNLIVNPTTAGLQTRISRCGLTVNGTTTVLNGGYLKFGGNNAGVKRFNGTITINPGGTWDNIDGEDFFVNCSIINNGFWPIPTGGNGRYDVDVNGNYTYSGSAEIGMTRLRLMTAATSAVTVTNTGFLTLTKTGNLGLSLDAGTFINGTGGYLKLISQATPVDINGGNVDFSAINNTVEYAYAGAQNIHPTNYYNLIASNGNTKSINGTTDASGTVTISGNTTIDVTGGTDFTGSGNIEMTGTSTLRISSSGTVPALTGTATLASGTTIELYRAGTQTAASSTTYPYQNLLISGNTGSAVNMSAVSTINGDLTFSNVGSMNSNAVLSVIGAVTYGSTASTTLANNLTAGSFSISSGTFIYTNRTITINGNNGFWAVSGTPTLTASGTSQVIFSAGTNQEIAGTSNPTFFGLTINNSNDVTLNIANATVTGSLTLTSGRLITGSNVLIAGTSTVSRTSGFVEGNLRKTIPIGTNTRTFEVGTNTDYTPVSVTTTSVTTSGTLTVQSVSGDHPEIASGLIEPNNTVNRYYSLTNSGIVFSAFSTGQIAATFNFVNADRDPAFDASAVVKWYNNSTLTWAGSNQFDELAEQNPVMTIANNALNTVMSVLNPTQLPTGQQVDFQIGEKIDPTYVYNRVTGTANWNSLTTWIQQRSGLISIAPTTGIVTGTSTNFQTELKVGDVIMLIGSPATTYTISSISAFPTQSMVVTPAPGSTVSGGFGRQYIPGIDSPTSDVDAVVIGNTNIPDVATAITQDISAKVLTIDIGSTALTTSQSLTSNAAINLNVLANASVNQPAGTATNIWNINDGTVTVSGDLSIGGTTNNSNRLSRITITTGTATVNNIKFRTPNSNGLEAIARLNLTTTGGTLNVAGAITFLNNRGRLVTTTGTTVNFNRTNGAQSIVIPSANNLPANWQYNNIQVSNTSTAGATFAFTSSASNFTGNLIVQPNANLKVVNFDIVGQAGSTFQLGTNATFEMKSSSNTFGGFPTGFGTFSLDPASTVYYNQTGNINPWPIATQTYGNLVVGENSNKNFRIANTTTNVAGSLTIGDGTSTPTLLGNTSATLAVAGAILINASATLDASNISTIAVGGNWTNNGTFTQSTNEVTFNSPAANTLQLIGGTTANTFYNLTLNTSAATDVVQLSSNATVSNTLKLTRGGLDLNGKTLNITRTATGAITRTSGYVKSENTSAPYGNIKWTMGTTTGSFVYPFGKSSTEYIPFIYNITGAGSPAAGSIAISTYATNSANSPLPTSVNNLNGTSGGTSVADRFWTITPNFTGNRPTANMTFTLLNTEVATVVPMPSDPLDELVAQRWNFANYWDAPVASPAQVYTVGVPAANTSQVVLSNFSNGSTYEAWTLSNKTVPLPIELISFDAFPTALGTQLEWVTASELNNDYFTIERSQTGEGFEPIGTVRGAGTKSNQSRYSLLDNNPLAGKSYYRLKQTDFDGKSSYSDLAEVTFASQNLWRIFPNPSDGKSVSVNLSSELIGKEVEVKIQDLKGITLGYQSSKVSDSGKIVLDQLPNLTSGVYLFTIACEGKISKQKLVVK